MKICDVTGRKYRNRRELAAELARLDAAIAGMEAIAQSFADLFDTVAYRPVPEAIGTAWNAAHDAVDALKRERAEVEANPRPIPAGEAGTYALVKQNID